MLAPPFLGAFIFTITGNESGTLAETVAGFFPFVLVAYFFSVVPSLLYMLAMELWFWLGLHARWGLPCTAVFSAFLGCGAGLLIEYVLDFQKISCPLFLWIGSLVGLLIGFYVTAVPQVF